MIRNFSKFTLTGAALLLVGFLPAAHATTLPSLHDWCVNINGDSSSLCNTGQTTVTVPAGVDGTGFDFTLDSQTEGSPATPYTGTTDDNVSPGVNDQNTLGQIKITLGPGASQSVLAFMDYDLNFNHLASGSFSDSASVHGTQLVTGATSVSYALDDYNTCTAGCGSLGDDIFNEFANNALPNTNLVSTYNSDGSCCDVSWALGLNLDVAVNTLDVITFSVSSTQPVSGFYLQQTSGTDNSQSVYLSASVDVESTGSGTPEPASWLLIAGGLAGAFLLRKRLTKAQSNLA